MLNKALIIAPLRVCYLVWAKEVKRWCDFHDLSLVVLHGPKKDELLQTEADVYVINPEGLDWLLQIEKIRYIDRAGIERIKVTMDLKRWKTFSFDTLVIDELSRFKHPSTQRFKALKLALATFDRRWGLTGSPAANGLMDLFGECYVLDQGRTLGQYITHFRLKYFNPSYDGFSWVLKEGAEEQIYERVKPLALRMSADDYLDMPQLVEQTITVQLPKATREVYDKLERDLFVKLDATREVTAATAAVVSSKVRQVAAGGIYIDQDVQALVKLPRSSREWVNLHTEKIDALVDLIDELQGSPLLVVYDFQHDLDRLRKKLGKDVACLGGGTTPKRAAALEAQWNAGDLPVMLVHPQVGGLGLNLHRCAYHICWHTLTWDYELFDQMIRRLLRHGNPSSRIFVHYLIAEDTIDEVVLAAVRSKGRRQNAFFDALKSRQKVKNRCLQTH